MTTPLISFIIPALNEEKWIENTLKSIKRQSYRNYEIIVVDSYSQDNTINLANKYTDKIIECDRKGPGFARNRGAEIAQGEILVFLDADTFLESRFAEKISLAFQKDSKIAICGLELKTLDGNLIHKMILKSLYVLMHLLAKIDRTIVIGACMACKKENFLKVKGFNEKLANCEDLDLSLKLCLTGKSKIIDSFYFFSFRRWKKLGNFNMFFKGVPPFFSIVLIRKGEIKNYKFGIFSDVSI
jgi:glycosyltransferase involved in cell wall biosynthesis